MELLLHKYEYKHHEYLICDCNKSIYAIGKEEIRVMCSSNFGINITSLLIGPVMENGELTLYSYQADGILGIVDEREKQVFTQYLSDTGYLTADNYDQEETPKLLSKIYLYDHFLEENNFSLCEKADVEEMQGSTLNHNQLTNTSKDYQQAV